DRRRAEEVAAAVQARGPIVPHPDELVRVAWLLETASWQFARTMADNPHHYSLRKTWQNDADFCFAVQFIRRHGHIERWPDPKRGWPYIRFCLGIFFYWGMGGKCEVGSYTDWPEHEILINRKPLENSSCP